MKKLVIISTLIVSALHSIAQRTYFETEITGELLKNFELSLSPQVRFRENFELKEYLLDAGVEYKFNKYFSLGTTYRLGTNISNDNEKTNFGRWSVDAKTSLKLDCFKPSFRLRYTNGNEDFENEDGLNVQYLRYKLDLACSMKSFKITPYIYTEYFQSLVSDHLNYTRFEGGLDYKISKHHKLGAYYRMNIESDSQKTQSIIGLSYKFKL